MKLWKRRWFCLAALFLTVLIAIQFGTYFAYGRRTIPQAALRRTLRKADFILIDAPTWNALTPSQRAALTTFLNRYVTTVYHSMAEVPANRTMREPNTDAEWRVYHIVATQPWQSPELVEQLKRTAEAGDHFVRFAGGYEAGWTLIGEGIFWMRSQVGHHGGNMDASGDDSTYVWVLGFWVRVRNNGGWIS